MKMSQWTVPGAWKAIPMIAVPVVLAGCYAWDPVVTVAVLSSAVRQATPLLLGALCGTLCERSGVMNIGIEGQMLFSAFLGFWVLVWSGSLLLGVAAGVAAGAACGLLLGVMSVSLKMDQIISGTIINMMAIGFSGYFYPTGMNVAGKIRAIVLPGLSGIPLVGPVLFSVSPLVLISIGLVFLLHGFLFFTRGGLRMRAVGEHPRAAATLGVRVYGMRYAGVILGGGLAGLAGAYLSLDAVGVFERGMTNGRGFIALAVMILGRWRPFGAWGAALLFGLALAVQTQLQFSQVLDVPHQFVGILPYLISILVLALFVGRTRPPASLGLPYEKE